MSAGSVGWVTTVVLVAVSAGPDGVAGTGDEVGVIRAGRRLETSPTKARLARRRVARSGIEVDQRVLHGERLPFDDGRFDCVVSTFTLCSVAGVGEALGEAYRVLRPGGKFLFLEHGLSPEPGVQRWQRRLNWLQVRLADGCRLDRDVRSLVTAQPFSLERIDQFYLERLPKTHGFMTRGVATK